MEERRKYHRLDTNQIFVSWRKIGTFDNLHRTRNISLGGIRLVIGREKIVNPQDLLQIEFRLPSGEFVYSKARVVWCQEVTISDRLGRSGYYAGIEFISISDIGREMLSNFLVHNG